MKLSNQALAAIMMALQDSLMKQTDITPVLRGFDLVMDDKEEVIVLNPPVIDALNVGESEHLNGSDENQHTVGSD